MVAGLGSSRVFARIGRLVRHGVIPTALAVGLSLVPFVPAQAAPGGVGGKPSPTKSVPVGKVKSRSAAKSQSETAVWSPGSVAWPSAGVAEVELPAARSANEAGPLMRAGSSPVSVGRAKIDATAPSAGATQPARARVEVLDQKAARAAGVNGLLLRVERADGETSTGPVLVDIDVSGFATAFGGDWASRLRLVRFPACVLTSPVAASCATPTPVDSSVFNNKTMRLSGQVDTAPIAVVTSNPVERKLAALDGLPTAEAEVLAVTAASASSDTGDFSKTPFSASYQWQAGNSGADFSWSYDMDVPPVPGDLDPEIGLSYSSGAVDGQTAGANVQPGWVGEGWNYSPGYIERSYRTCADDTANSPYYADATADQCWRLPNAHLVWGGKSTELIIGSDGKWRAADDDAAKVELLTGAGNYDNDGEHWRVATVDGTQFYFGLNRLPDWSTGKRETQSAWNVPVFANHSGEPCFVTTGFANSHCNQAWRWNLDYVVDANSNSMAYFYTKEQSRTGLAGNANSVITYDRGGWLDHIEYGMRAGTELVTTTPPAKVVFATAERCLSSCWSGAAWTSTANTANWPDTPWDLYCATTATSCANNVSPSFWSARRLTGVTTQIWSGSGTTYNNVDQWDFTHQFPSTGNGTSPVLWLASIVHTGKANGGSTALPSVTFGGTRFDNRADYDPNGTMAQPRKYRITTVNTETGGQLAVAYSGQDSGCQFGSPFPDPDNNTNRCFPQYYKPQQAPEGWSWWHKYIVNSVTEQDLVGGSPDVVHSYAYSTANASTAVLWAHDEGPTTWTSPLAKRSWADWRGYPTVTVTEGPAGAQTQTQFLYFRGLKNDYTDAGENTRTSTITDSNTGVWQDAEYRAGFLHEKIEFDGAGGQPLKKTIIDPVAYQTGQRTLSSSWAIPTVQTSYINRTAKERTWTWLPVTSTWRTTNTVWTHDTFGQVATESDEADTATTADDTCTTYTYASNTTANLRRFDGTGPSAINLLPSVVAADWSGYDLTFPAGDFNADGKKDLIARWPADGSMWLIPGNGAGGYNAAVKIGNSGWNAFQDIISPGDMTGDGKPDVVASKPDGTLWRYNNATDLANPTQIGATSWQNFDLFSPGDFTGDGKGDVLGRHTNGALYMWPGTGTGTVGAGVQIGTSGWGAYSQAFGWGDITGDGKTDFMAADQAGIWLYAGNGVAAGTYAPRVRMATGLIGLDSNWFVASSDITGDGKADLLARQSRYLASPLASEHTEAVSCPATPTFPADAVDDTRRYFDQPGATNPSLAALPVVGNVTRTDQADKYNGTSPNWITTSEATYDQWGRQTTAKDALGRTTTTAYTHGANGLLTSYTITNPALHASTITVDSAWGMPTTATDANGKTATGQYDALGRLAKVWLPGRSTSDTGNQEYIYSITKTAPSYVQSKVLGPNGNQISSFEIYDGLLRLRQTQSTAPDGKRAIADVQYDARGLTAKTSAFYNNVSGPTGVLVGFADTDVASQRRLAYDGLERQTVDALWSLNTLKWQATTSYDGDRVNVDPPDGATPTTTILDAHGRKTALRQYQGSTPSGAYDETRYSYDRLDRLVGVTDAAGNAWTYGYDLLGRQTSRVDPDAGTTTSIYDNAGQLITTTDGRGEVLARKYDNLGRLTELHDDTTSGPLRASYIYDTLAKGQLTSSTRHIGSDAYTTTITGYTDRYAPTGVTVTIPAVEGGLAGTYTSTATYNPDGSPATTGLPAVGGLPAETLTYSYSNTGLPTTLTGAATYVAATEYAWDASVSRRLLGAAGKQVRLTDTRDEATRRLTTRQVDTENQTTPGTFDDKSTSEYGYDQAGNVLAIAGKTNGARDQVECFRYDYLRRLTDAWTEADWACQTPQRTGVDPYQLSWTYDSVGNRRTQTSHSATGTTTATSTYPAAGGPDPHQLTKVDYTGETTRTDTYDYDNAGNTTTRTVNGNIQTLTWDPEGHLATTTENGQNTSYVYDPAGNRLLRRDSGGTTLYLGDTELRLTTGGQIDGTRYYQHGGTTVAVRTVTGLTWLVADHHNTNQLAIDPTNLTVTRRRTMPFGEPRGTQPTGWPGEKGFVGGTTDPTGLTHLGAREYDPTTGRFISIDPLQDLSDPQQWNGYTYATNTPVTSSDPTGLIPEDCNQFNCSGYQPGNEAANKKAKKNNSCWPAKSCKDYKKKTKPRKPRKPRKPEAAAVPGVGGPGDLPKGGDRPYEPPKKTHGKPHRLPGNQGYEDRHGNRWTWDKLHKDHWDVNHKDGSHTNVFPDGRVRGEDNFPNKSKSQNDADSVNRSAVITGVVVVGVVAVVGVCIFVSGGICGVVAGGALIGGAATA